MLKAPPAEHAKAWYLVYCKPRQENVAKRNLERQGFVVYLPLVRQFRRRRGQRVGVIGPLFPRYLFIYLSKETDNWRPIRSTLGVSSLVRFGLHPAVIPDDLVAFLQARDDMHGVQDLPPPDYHTGQGVRVTQGVMRDFEGIYLAKSGKERVLILLEIMGKGTRVVVPSDHIESLNH